MGSYVVNNKKYKLDCTQKCTPAMSHETRDWLRSQQV
jgi:hypothetical protein